MIQRRHKVSAKTLSRTEKRIFWQSRKITKKGSKLNSSPHTVFSFFLVLSFWHMPGISFCSCLYSVIQWICLCVCVWVRHTQSYYSYYYYFLWFSRLLPRLHYQSPDPNVSIKDKYNLMPTPRSFIMYFYSMKQVSKMERKPFTSSYS